MYKRCRVLTREKREKTGLCNEERLEKDLKKTQLKKTSNQVPSVQLKQPFFFPGTCSTNLL